MAEISDLIIRANTQQFSILKGPTSQSEVRKVLDRYAAFDRVLATATIIYEMPDHQDLLQWFVWQEYDLHPLYPRLRKFLNFWENNVEANLHTVLVMSGKYNPQGHIVYADEEYKLH